MKVHYINILLFALPLNILLLSSQEHNQRNLKSIPQHVPITRLLCECDLYIPNYDNDPQMKYVMDNFNKQTQQRFHEYDDRMTEKRKQCKDRCDKEIQKIILKDKLEKELMDKFAILQTDIQNDAIPTCICEKSLADKVEKGCLRCGYGLGTVAPTVGLIGAVAVDQLTSVLTASAMEYATKKGIEAGIKVVIEKMKDFPGLRTMTTINWSNFIKGSNYNTVDGLMKAANAAMDSIGQTCTPDSKSISIACNAISNGKTNFSPVVTAAKEDAAAKTKSVQTTTLGEVATTSYEGYATVGYSVLAIIIIILIMVIIYLILRYRRKKKMKKKLKYIKLLEE
ncbi:rifin [Plasmodium reichenowi]|uniref:Rifin n=1 Tax=Plasmodium reichenowi TaxID=5854 RepID=A0A060RMQ5_PLARE|nr:rifin [Plasmodium reichenowi]